MCMTPAELNIAVHDLKELKAMQSKLDARIKEIEDQIKLHMADTDTFAYSTDEYSVSWYEVSSSRIDTTAIKRDLPDLAKQYTRTTITRRFLVS